MFEETTTYRRQQQRRGIIAWGTGIVFIALFAISLVFAPDGRRVESQSDGPFSYLMTSEEYESLMPGLSQADFYARIEKPGVPEDHVRNRYTELFPAPEAGTTCFFWQISDRVEELARICFDEDQRLVQKLERSAEEDELGVQV